MARGSRELPGELTNQRRADNLRLGEDAPTPPMLRVPETMSVQVRPHVRIREGLRPDDHADGCRDG